jgi:hypothetical protein
MGTTDLSRVGEHVLLEYSNFSKFAVFFFRARSVYRSLWLVHWSCSVATILDVVDVHLPILMN